MSAINAAKVVDIHSAEYRAAIDRQFDDKRRELINDPLIASVAIASSMPSATPALAVVKAATPAKKEKAEKAKQGREVDFNEPDPWSDRVDGAALLDSMVGTFSKYIALPDHAAAALALYVMHAYTVDTCFTSPILAITSPMPRCGKTIVLIVLGAFVPRRMFASSVTPAVLFRTIEKYGPTLLIDEADTFIADNEELRGVLNSGHTRTTAVVIRAVGDDHDPREFSTWCPKAIAMIGKLPTTLADRSIEVPMRRRTPGELVERLRQDRIESECADQRSQAARWALDSVVYLTNADPDVPTALHDRAADCWRPLLAIADCAGGHWPALAREAALGLSGVTEEEEQPFDQLLLNDVKIVFDTKKVDRLSSADIIAALRTMDAKPWLTCGRDGNGLTPFLLSRCLKNFKISPVRIRFGSELCNGYYKHAFVDAWERYRVAVLASVDTFPEKAEHSEQPEQPPVSLGHFALAVPNTSPNSREQSPNIRLGLAAKTTVPTPGAGTIGHVDGRNQPTDAVARALDAFKLAKQSEAK